MHMELKLPGNLQPLGGTWVQVCKSSTPVYLHQGSLESDSRCLQSGPRGYPLGFCLISQVSSSSFLWVWPLYSSTVSLLGTLTSFTYILI